MQGSVQNNGGVTFRLPKGICQLFQNLIGPGRRWAPTRVAPRFAHSPWCPNAPAGGSSQRMQAPRDSHLPDLISCFQREPRRF